MSKSEKMAGEKVLRRYVVCRSTCRSDDASVFLGAGQCSVDTERYRDPGNRLIDDDIGITWYACTKGLSTFQGLLGGEFDGGVQRHR